MTSAMLPPPTTDPRELRVIILLGKEGFTPREICQRLNISQATYYRRLAEIRRLEQEAKRSREHD